jgi:hypothetical protein
MTRVVEPLPSNRKVLSSNPSTKKKKSELGEVARETSQNRTKGSFSFQEHQRAAGLQVEPQDWGRL